MSFLLDLIFPRTCFGCGKVGQYLCPPCRSKIILKSVKPNDRLSLFRYHGAIKNLITSLKFDFVFDIIPELTDFMAESLIGHYPHLLSYWQENNFVLVPVPLHPRRFNWRGFNQSELICQQLSSKLKLDFDSNILVRTKNTSPQTTIKDKLLRKSNVTSSFIFNPPFVKGGGPVSTGPGDLNVILVDDVYTTGSTIKSAKSVFPKNFEIWSLTLAG